MAICSILHLQAMPAMETISQPDPMVSLQVDMKESARRHLKAAAVKSGLTMGEFLTALLADYADYEAPVEESRRA